MPRRPGTTYSLVAMELRAVAWAASRLGARLRVVEAPSLKEVHVVVGGRVFSVKVVERRWWVPPALLKTYARNLLRHGKEHGKTVYPAIVAGKLTSGALGLAARLRWFRLVPASSMTVRQLLYWVLQALADLVYAAIGVAEKAGRPTRWLRLVLRALRNASKRLA